MRATECFYTNNMRVLSYQNRSDLTEHNNVAYVIKDIFTTKDGSWEVGQHPEDCEMIQWPIIEYLKPYGDDEYFDDAGASHHLFARVEDANGNKITNVPFYFWSDGIHKLNDPTYTDYAIVSPKETSGWANLAMFPGSTFYPEEGMTGPWCWMLEGPSDVIIGGGLPNQEHVSTFVVWKEIDLDFPIEPPIDPPIEPPTNCECDVDEIVERVLEELRNRLCN